MFPSPVIKFSIPPAPFTALRAAGRTPATPWLYFSVMLLRQEILIILVCKVILCTGLSAQRLTVTDLLQIVQAAGDSLIAVGIESIKVDARPAVHTAVNFRMVNDRLPVCVHNARSRGAVGIDE